MQVTIEHLPSGEGRQKNARAVMDWAEEHAGYYGLPHGATTLLDSPWGIERAGLVPAWKALAVFLRLLPERAEELISGYVREPNTFGGWITSAGNLTLTALHLEYREGRRHGVRPAQPCGPKSRWIYLESQRPDASPDAMDLTPRPDDA